MKLTAREAEIVLWGVALTVINCQGRSKKWRPDTDEHITLGKKLSRQYEADFNLDPGWFERFLGGTPVIDPRLPKGVLALYGIPAPVSFPYSLPEEE